jgi:hypothetical protein
MEKTFAILSYSTFSDKNHRYISFILQIIYTQKILYADLIIR